MRNIYFQNRSSLNAIYAFSTEFLEKLSSNLEYINNITEQLRKFVKRYD